MAKNLDNERSEQLKTFPFQKIQQKFDELTKNSPFKWTDLHRETFIKLKTKLCERPVLAIYNPQLKLELHTDASSVGIAGIILQVDNFTNEKRSISYFSRNTALAEKNYHSYKLETLAAVIDIICWVDNSH